MADNFKGIKRGRSQIMFQYLPGATFSEKDYWYKVESLRVRPFVGKTQHLLNYVYNFVENWDSNQDMDNKLYPQIDDMYYFGEIDEVHYELFPLNFYCKKCGNVHPFWDLQTLFKQNPGLNCEYCKVGKLKQYPYVLVHANGDIQSIRVAVNEGKIKWRDKYFGVRMKDTRTFKTATWFNYRTGASLGELGTKTTTLPLTKQMIQAKQRRMSGTHLSDGSVYYPQLKSIVNLKHDTLTDRMENERFPYIQLGALFGLEGINKKHYASNFEMKESDMFQKLLKEQENNDVLRNALLEFAAKENLNLSSSGTDISSVVSELFYGEVPVEKICSDQKLHEFIFSWYENGGETIEDKLKETVELNQVEQNSVFRVAKETASELGLDSIMLLERFPVLMMGIGYTRRFSNKKQAVINPFKQRIQEKYKILIPLLRNENEAIIFKLDPLRVLVWLQLNEFVDKDFTPASKQAAHAFLYNHLQFSINDDEKIAQMIAGDYKGDHNALATIMTFKLLHSYVHCLFQAGKTILGLDIDSLSEYLFPSALSGVIYVSKLQGGGMGALISAFDNDLPRWLEGVYDKSNTCLYDPVCHQHTGACHACMFLKFSCNHFNHGLSRNLLIGGKYPDYDERTPIVGYFSQNIDKVLQQWGINNRK